MARKILPLVVGAAALLAAGVAIWSYNDGELAVEGRGAARKEEPPAVTTVELVTERVLNEARVSVTPGSGSLAPHVVPAQDQSARLLCFVDAVSKKPIQGVELRPLSRFASSLDELETIGASDARGCVEFDPRDWSPFDVLMQAPGYELHALPLELIAARALPIELRPSGPLTVVVRAPRAIRADVVVEVSFARGALYDGTCNGDEAQRMRSRLQLDEQMRARFLVPPTGTEIEIAAAFAPKRGHRQTVSLARGGSGEVYFDFARASTVRGTLKAGKVPLADITLMLESIEPWSVTESAPAPGKRVESRTAITDALGAFRFTDVPSGRWTVGTNPGLVRALALAATPSIVEVKPRPLKVFGDGQEIVMDVDATVGWYIAGHVIDADGERMTSGRVERRSEDERTFFENVNIGSDGAFVMGPIHESAAVLRATVDPNLSGDTGRGAEERSAIMRSSSILVAGPTSDLILRLGVSGCISGGTASAASTVVFSLLSDAERYDVYRSRSQPHHFRFEALPPGTYSVLAKEEVGGDGSLRMGVRGPIELTEGSHVDSLDVKLDSAAKITLRTDRKLEPHEWTSMHRVEVDGVCIGWATPRYADESDDGVPRELGRFDNSIAVPAGHVQVWSGRSSAMEPGRLVAEFDVATGEARDVVVPIDRSARR